MKLPPKPVQTTPRNREQRDTLASIGMFAAAMAHEIRNPLTAIKARLFTLERALDEHSPAREDARLIGKEITRLEQIVREFLQYARPADPVLEQLDPKELFQYVIELLAPQLKSLQIEIVQGETTETRLEADSHQLRQVLINLVQNAAESIGDHGRITLSASRGTLPESGRPAISLEITDTGKGIPPELHAHLFDPFFTDKPSGTGLGLPTAARVIAKHGGTISFSSEVSRGTTFTVALPAVECT